MKSHTRPSNFKTNHEEPGSHDHKRQKSKLLTSVCTVNSTNALLDRLIHWETAFPGSKIWQFSVLSNAQISSWNQKTMTMHLQSSPDFIHNADSPFDLQSNDRHEREPHRLNSTTTKLNSDKQHILISQSWSSHHHHHHHPSGVSVWDIPSAPNSRLQPSNSDIPEPREKPSAGPDPTAPGLILIRWGSRIRSCARPAEKHGTERTLKRKDARLNLGRGSVWVPSAVCHSSRRERACVCVRFGSCDGEGEEEMRRGGGERERLVISWNVREREREREDHLGLRTMWTKKGREEEFDATAAHLLRSQDVHVVVCVVGLTSSSC